MDINRMRWASRRGMLELDLILMPFLDNVVPTLSERELELFERLLTCEDQDLYAWFLDRVDPEDMELKRIVDIVRKNTGMHASR